MVAYNKVNDFVEQLGLGKHNLNTDQLNVYLTNTAPSAASAVKADVAEIATGNGYSADGADTQNTWAETGGVATLTGTKVVFTASGGSIGPFRYVGLINVTQTSPLKPFVAYFDYGSAITLAAGETFSVKWNGSDTTGSIATLT